MKTLCELSKKELAQHAQKIVNGQDKPKFVCEKCARVSSTKKPLGGPQKAVW